LGLGFRAQGLPFNVGKTHQGFRRRAAVPSRSYTWVQLFGFRAQGLPFYAGKTHHGFRRRAAIPSRSYTWVQLFGFRVQGLGSTLQCREDSPGISLEGSRSIKELHMGPAFLGLGFRAQGLPFNAGKTRHGFRRRAAIPSRSYTWVQFFFF
jgi:hypothetical protein